MSIESSNWARRTIGHRSLAQKAVLQNIAERYNPSFHNGYAFVSQLDLAEECEITERALRNHLKNLASDGFIVITPGHQHATAGYKPTMDESKALPKERPRRREPRLPLGEGGSQDSQMGPSRPEVDYRPEPPRPAAGVRSETNPDRKFSASRPEVNNRSEAIQTGSLVHPDRKFSAWGRAQSTLPNRYITGEEQAVNFSQEFKEGGESTSSSVLTGTTGVLSTGVADPQKTEEVDEAPEIFHNQSNGATGYPSAAARPPPPPGCDCSVCSCYRAGGKSLDTLKSKALHDLADQYGLDLTSEALVEALTRDNVEAPIPYTKTILEDWAKEGRNNGRRRHGKPGRYSEEVDPYASIDRIHEHGRLMAQRRGEEYDPDL